MARNKGSAHDALGNEHPDQTVRDHAASLDPELTAYVGRLLTDDVVRRSSRVDWDRARVVLGLAALQRIRRVWCTLFGHELFALRVPNDEELYQRLRSGLIAQLDGDSRHDRARQAAIDALPDELPTSDDLVAFDAELYSFYEGGFQRLEAELIRLALAEGLDPDIRNAEMFFVTHDDYLNQLEPKAAKAIDERARALGLQPKDGPRTTSARNPSASRGRRPTQLLYEVAQRVWCEMRDDYEDEGEPRRPSQRDLCARLSDMGIPIADRTLRMRIRSWQQEQLAWPPPRPES